SEERELSGCPTLSSHARASRPTVLTTSVLPFHFATECPYHAGPRFSRFSPDGSARPSVHSIRTLCSDWNSWRTVLAVMMNSIGSSSLRSRGKPIGLHAYHGALPMAPFASGTRP